MADWGMGDTAPTWGMDDTPKVKPRSKTREFLDNAGGLADALGPVAGAAYNLTLDPMHRATREASKGAERLGFIDSIAQDFNTPREEAVGLIQSSARKIVTLPGRASRALAEGAGRGMYPEGGHRSLSGGLIGGLKATGGAMKEAYQDAKGLIGGGIGMVASPITGTIDVAINPIARGMEQLGLGDEQYNKNVLNAASMVIPGIGEAKGAGAVRSVARTSKSLAPVVEQFERAGVSPSLATANGKGTVTLANAVMENPLAGIPARARTNAQIGQAAAKADEIGAAYGSPRGRQIAGEGVQEGVARFARDKGATGSFAQKSGDLYDKAFAPIQAGEKEQISANGASPVVASETEATLNVLANRANGEIGAMITDPRIGKLGEAIRADKGVTTFQDLRELRTWVRTAQKSPELRQGIDDASLQSMERALTADIYSNAEALGGPKAAADLRRADQYYRLGSERIKTALQPFSNAKSGEGAYDRVIQAAGSTGSADAQKLASLKRSLNPDEWGDVSSTLIKEMGRPAAGGAGVVGGEGFSISNFVTGYNKLSPAGREILFGSRGGGGAKATSLKAELDNLVQVVDRLKAVERGANTSKSGISIQTVGTIGGLANPVTMPTAIATLSGMGVAGELMTNPRFVRWLASLEKGATGSQSVKMRQLQTLAKTSPAIAQFARQIETQSAEKAPAIPAASELVPQ